MLKIIKYRKMESERYSHYLSLICNIRKELKDNIHYVYEPTLNISYEEFNSFLTINNIIEFSKKYFDSIKNNNISINNYVEHIIKNADIINECSIEFKNEHLNTVIYALFFNYLLNIDLELDSEFKELKNNLINLGTLLNDKDNMDYIYKVKDSIELNIFMESINI